MSFQQNITTEIEVKCSQLKKQLIFLPFFFLKHEQTIKNQPIINTFYWFVFHKIFLHPKKRKCVVDVFTDSLVNNFLNNIKNPVEKSLRFAKWNSREEKTKTFQNFSKNKNLNYILNLCCSCYFQILYCSLAIFYCIIIHIEFKFLNNCLPLNNLKLNF